MGSINNQDKRLGAETGLEDDLWDVVESRKSKKAYFIPFLIIPLIAMGYFGYSFLEWWLTGNKVEKIQSELTKSNVVVEETYEITPIFAEPIKKESLQDIYDFLIVDFEELKKRNSDIRAWLKVNNTSVDYPVVQTTDNEFYLTRDLDKKKSSAGWLFFDFRSDVNALGFNTIIYGHNRVDGVMFGTLHELLKEEVNSLPDSSIIKLTTPNNKMVFEIVSVYPTEFDDDVFFSVNFRNDKEKQWFIDAIQSKNVVPAFASNNLSVMDNFLTLSTCYGGAGTTKRLIVHARLVAMI